MALTVEDGSIVTGADSFVSVADADTYFTNHGSPSDWTGASTGAKESALRYAARFLGRRYIWIGSIVNTAQVLSWPRYGVSDNEGRTWSGSEIPRVVIDAQCEFALAHIVNEALNKVVEKDDRVIESTIGPITDRWAVGVSRDPSYDYVDGLLHGLFSRVRGSSQVELVA